MEIIMMTLMIIFFILNLVIYHKVFTVFYFNLGEGIKREILVSLLLSCFETALVVYVGGYVLIGIAIIVGIVLIFGFIKKIVGGIRTDTNNISKELTSEEKENQDTYYDYVGENDVADTSNNINSSEVVKNASESEISKMTQTMSVGEAIKIIKEKYSSSERINAMKEFRELTGLGLKEAKEIVDQIVEDEKVTTVVSGCETLIEEKRIFCPYCGKSILLNKKYCCYCGNLNTYKK